MKDSCDCAARVHCVVPHDRQIAPHNLVTWHNQNHYWLYTVQYTVQYAVQYLQLLTIIVNVKKFEFYFSERICFSLSLRN